MRVPLRQWWPAVGGEGLPIGSLGYRYRRLHGKLDNADTGRSEAIVRRRWLRVLAAVAAPIVTLVLPSAPAQATAGVLVFPGMEVRQGTNVCTLGYVDPQMRIAFTAGHCRGSGVVSDRDGNPIGNQTLFRDNTPNGATIDTNHQIADWEAISLAPDDAANNILPGGRQLIADPAVVPAVGLPVCHFGVVTG